MKIQHDQKQKLETLKIALTSATIDSWKLNEDDKCSYLENELKKNDDLIGFINRYQKDRWEVYCIDEVIISDPEGNKGYIQLDFSKHLFNGCKDLDAEDDDDLDLSFEINYDSREILISGDPIQEARSTFEEF